MQPTAPIPTIVLDEVLAAITAAQVNLRDAAHPDAPAAGHYPANLAVEYLAHVAALVRDDQHDPLMHLRIGDAIATMLDLAPTLASSMPMRTAARRLRLAGLLLQSARRQADLERRLRDILPLAQDITETARKDATESRTRDILIAGTDIARLARA
jgi:hypothetical protein